MKTVFVVLVDVTITVTAVAAAVGIWQKVQKSSVPRSVVGIATGYGMDGPWIESRWGRYFPLLFRPAPGPTQPPVRWVPGISRW